MFAGEKLIKEIKEFDNAFPDGVFSIPRSPDMNMPRVKVRALWDYCQGKGGVEPKELSSEEIKQFLDY